MKLQSWYRFNRSWLAVLIVLAGAGGGFLIGRESILRTTGARLKRQAALIVSRADEARDEYLKTLGEANASPYPACSEQDIALLRRLTFVARYLKDVARLDKDHFLCSAAFGKVAFLFPAQSPAMTLPGGVSVYRRYPSESLGGEKVSILTQGRSLVVVSPGNYAEFDHQPIGYSMFYTNTARSLLPISLSKLGQMQRSGDRFMLEQCSVRYPVCVATSAEASYVWESAHGLMVGYVSTGTVAGSGCAFLLLLAGRRGRSPTNQLKRAIVLGKLTVAYQPVIELGSNRIVGAEALARWTDEEGDKIRPETIVALAEADGFVSEVTRFVLVRALTELQPLFQQDPTFQVSINLASSDLADPRLLLLLDEYLGSAALTPTNIAFEMPERAMFEREAAIGAIRRLRERGHAVYIDEFGTGYSDLAHLSELNVDGIKINRSFIAMAGTESVTASIVPQILGVAGALNLKVVVQGIEREEQARYFREGDPKRLAQGWYFGMPVPARGLMLLCAEKTE